MTNFSAVDGLALPVRDVAVDRAGVAWLATDGACPGLFRRGGVSTAWCEIHGASCGGGKFSVPGTPLRAVTISAGRFVLANVSPGMHRLV